MTGHGMAARIRAASESETFDLAGQNATTISNTLQAAFKDPFTSFGNNEQEEEMIRITFIVGAGKQARQKYDTDATKVVTSTLRELGYEEDRAASCVRECAGLYKQQHDTGKNVKTVVVFPKLLDNTSGSGTKDDANNYMLPPLLRPGSLEDRIATSSLSVFQNMIKSKCPSWSQKKGCMGVLESLRELLDDIDRKLVKGIPLTPREQSFWESLEALEEKEAHVKAEMLAQVEGGQITQFERDLLLEHNAERIASIQSDLREARSNGATKKRQHQLETMLGKVQARRDLLQDITEPIPPPKLRNEAAIRKLWKELMPLLKAEQQFRGRLLNIKESQMMGRKEEIEEEIEELEEASRGWFEDDAVFQSRVAASRAGFVVKRSATSSSSRKTPTGSSYAAVAAAASVTSIGSSTTTKVSKWVTPGETGKKSKSPKKLGKARGADVFSRMVIDSDDDEEEEEDDEEEENRSVTPPPPPRRHQTEARDAEEPKEDHQQQHSPNNKANKSNKKKKKKKKGTSSSPKNTMTEEEAMQRAIAVNVAAEEERKKKEVEDATWLSLVTSLLLAILAWLVSLLLSPFTTTKKKAANNSSAKKKR